MTDLEKRVKARLIEDEYAEKLHRLEMEEVIARLCGEKVDENAMNKKRLQMELEMEFEKNLLNY